MNVTVSRHRCRFQKLSLYRKQDNKMKNAPIPCRPVGEAVCEGPDGESRCLTYD